MALNFLMKDPREITFELNNQKISPEQVFKHLYDGLDNLISDARARTPFLANLASFDMSTSIFFPVPQYSSCPRVAPTK